MSEKRFKLSSETVLQYQIMDNDTDLNENEVVDLLNTLFDENEQLREEIKIKDNILETVGKENEQLRQQANDLKDYLYNAERTAISEYCTGNEYKELEIAYKGSIEEFLDYFRSDEDER